MFNKLKETLKEQRMTRDYYRGWVYGKKAKNGYYFVPLEFPVHPRPRYGHGKPPHANLWKILNGHRRVFEKHLQAFLEFEPHLLRIEQECRDQSLEPQWKNRFFYSLDAIALYCFLGKFQPNIYLEIGSGHSTRFARRAIQDLNLQTEIISIDPFAEQMHQIVARIIKKPLEEADLSMFELLEAGDILFFDGSHRCFTNSDVTVFFLDILPNLKPGVVVHIHDIWLPLDYPPEWNDRFYSEQYLLAMHLLSGSPKLQPLLANAFVSEDLELSRLVDPLLSRLGYAGFAKKGTSFWFEVG